MYPKEYRYSKEHEWLHVEGDEATLGITLFAQSELGDVVFVELPEVGDTFSAHDEIGTIESVKATADIFIPVSGEISAVNSILEDSPETVNEDPHSDGWLIKVKLSDASEVDELMTAEDYEDFLPEA